MTRPMFRPLPLVFLLAAAGGACNDASGAGDVEDGDVTQIGDGSGSGDGGEGSGDVGRETDTSADEINGGGRDDAGGDASTGDDAEGDASEGDGGEAPDAFVIDVDPGDADDDGEAIDAGPAPDAAIDAAPEDTGPPPTWDSGDPSVAGPYAFERFTETVNLTVQDVELIIYVPSDAADAPYPVVVFNHGFQMNGAAYQPYGERLASHGFVAILPTIGDSLFNARSHTSLAEIQVNLNAWIESAAERPGSRLFGVADATRLGVGGHSRGGKASIFAATLDPRIRASLNVDPVDSGPPFGGNPTDFPSVTPELMGSLAIPMGFVGASEGASGFPACAPAADNYREYFNAAPSPAFEYVVRDAGHNDFVADCNVTCRFACARGDEGARALAYAQTITVAFYKVFLAGDTSYRPWVDGPQVPSWVVFSAR